MLSKVNIAGVGHEKGSSKIIKFYTMSGICPHLNMEKVEMHAHSSTSVFRVLTSGKLCVCLCGVYFCVVELI